MTKGQKQGFFHLFISLNYWYHLWLLLVRETLASSRHFSGTLCGLWLNESSKSFGHDGPEGFSCEHVDLCDALFIRWSFCQSVHWSVGHARVESALTRIYDAAVGIVSAFEGVNGGCMALPSRLQWYWDPASSTLEMVLNCSCQLDGRTDGWMDEHNGWT